MEVQVIDDLVCDATSVGEEVEVLLSAREGDLLECRNDLCEVVVGDVLDCLAVVFGDDEGVLGCDGPDIEEAVDLVCLEELHGRDLTLDDLAEEAGIVEVSVRGHRGRLMKGRRWEQASAVEEKAGTWTEEWSLDL